MSDILQNMFSCDNYNKVMAEYTHLKNRGKKLAEKCNSHANDPTKFVECVNETMPHIIQQAVNASHFYKEVVIPQK